MQFSHFWKSETRALQIEHNIKSQTSSKKSSSKSHCKQKNGTVERMAHFVWIWKEALSLDHTILEKITNQKHEERQRMFGHTEQKTFLRYCENHPWAGAEQASAGNQPVGGVGLGTVGAVPLRGAPSLNRRQGRRRTGKNAAWGGKGRELEA